MSAAGDASAWDTPSGPGSPARDSPSGPGSPASDNSSGPGSPAPAVPVLSLRHATKSFGAVRAVVDGSADLYAGEAHALLGENGAGKSTVVKMLAGVYQPDEGQVLIDGAPVTLHSPAAASACRLTRRESPAACRSPTSRWSRSARRCCWTRG